MFAFNHVFNSEQSNIVTVNHNLNLEQIPAIAIKNPEVCTESPAVGLIITKINNNTVQVQFLSNFKDSINIEAEVLTV